MNWLLNTKLCRMAFSLLIEINVRADYWPRVIVLELGECPRYNR